jgi:serine/threonine protein kinase/O-acetyl-ADP-ribose deacetylase (regulator of RNase III)
MTVKVFFCHHENDARYCDELAKHLRFAERSQQVELWNRRRVQAGQDVRRVVDEKLEQASLIVVLMSVDLLDCDYCWGVEVSAALQRHRAGRARVIPVIVRACDWRACFAELQQVPASGSPLVTDTAKIEDARFLEAATEIMGAVRALEGEPTDSAASVTKVADITLELRRLEEQSYSSAAEATEGLLRLSAGLRYMEPSSATSFFVDENAMTRVIPEDALAPMRRAYARAYSSAEAPAYPASPRAERPGMGHNDRPVDVLRSAASPSPGDYVKPTVRLVSKVGAGGMGSVWQAENLTLGTPVAVKLMTPHHLHDQGLRQRFKQEAYILARIQSPHVVQVLDYGETDAGVPYILMELLDGETLGSRLQTLGPMPLADVLRIVTQLASALSQAHTFGVVHRDLKPENIFLIQVGGELFVKVIDFGIAKLPPADLHNVLTITGQMLGTPSYMSPEAMVSSKDVDQRADVWALAAIAYEAMTGRRPFQGKSFGEVILATHAGVFTKPTALQPGLPESIDAWAERALKRDPAARFGSVREAADAFRDAVHGTVHGVPPAHSAPFIPQAEPAAPPPPARTNTPAPTAFRARASGPLNPDVPAAEPTLLSSDYEIAAPELPVGRGRVRLVLGSILRAGTEAIVNSIQSSFEVSGALDEAIRAAGGPELEEELLRIGGCEVGSAVVTGAGRIPRPTRIVIHAVGPSGAPRDSEEWKRLLRSAHAECLRLAEESGVRSVAFPGIGAERSGYPIRRAADIAFSVAVDHLAERAGSVDLIAFVLSSPADFAAFAAALASSAAALPSRLA